MLRTGLAVLALLTACAPSPRNDVFAHTVYFTLAEPTEPRVADLVRDCHALAEIPGILLLDVGPRANEWQRPVNDQDFDVVLHIVFQDEAAYRAYADHPTHTALVTRWQPSLRALRVFDWRPRAATAPPAG